MIIANTIVPLSALLSCAYAAVTQPLCRPTASDIEGPYYVPGAESKKLQVCSNASPAHDRLVITGRVISSQDCKSPVRAHLDVWHADLNGKYSTAFDKGGDMECRAVIETDKNGNFKFVTLMPGRYDDDGFRPAHIHFKITPIGEDGNGAVIKFKPLLTQLYFQDDAFLDHDSCRHCNSEDPSLVVSLVHLADIKTFVGHWDVILDTVTEGGASSAAASDAELKQVPEGAAYTEVKDHIVAPSDDLSTLQKENQQLKDQVYAMSQKLIKQEF
ncbi:hypothetical protein MP228_007276 [Amoeboaphelidium protococcarum]|nr:hypothetical protein MP228_007276 [Amoeboaphelidium protococcarum]